MRTLYNDTLVRASVNPASRTNGTVNGTAVDLGVFNNDFRTAQVVVVSGAITDGSHAVTVEESADGSTGWTAIPAGRLQGSAPTLTSTDANKVFQLGVMPVMQYIRVVVTTSGATTGGITAAVAILGGGSFYPTNKS